MSEQFTRFRQNEPHLVLSRSLCIALTLLANISVLEGADKDSVSAELHRFLLTDSSKSAGILFGTMAGPDSLRHGQRAQLSKITIFGWVVLPQNPYSHILFSKRGLILIRQLITGSLRRTDSHNLTRSRSSTCFLIQAGFETM